MKDVQQIGGSFETESIIVGLPRQIRVDTSNWRILLHDGLTVGGKVFVGKDESDLLYQPIDADLSSLATFANGVRGAAFRTQDGTYNLRTLTGTLGEIIVTNGNGIAGNPTFALSDNITKDITWSGLHEFLAPVDGSGGWNGPTAGTHTGEVVGDSAGTHTGPSNGTHTGAHVGSVDVRGEALLLDNDQVPQEAVAGLAESLAAAFPAGGIIMWSGDETDVPAGWALCDGLNGTPDLQDRFIIGAAPTEAHAVGGSSLYTPAGTIGAAGSHTHTATGGDHALTVAQMPSHTHPTGVCDGGVNLAFNNGSVAANPTSTENINTNSGAGTVEAVSKATGGGAAHSHTVTIDSAGNHTHAFAGTEATVVPPYYALCFIMKA